MALDHPSAVRRRHAPALQQQQAAPTDTRQQQQDNGTHEFQPLQQQAAWHRDEEWRTLGACPQRGERRSERVQGFGLARRAELRLAK